MNMYSLHIAGIAFFTVKEEISRTREGRKGEDVPLPFACSPPGACKIIIIIIIIIINNNNNQHLICWLVTCMTVWFC